MATMRAWVLHKTGPPAEVLQLVNDWPKPVPTGAEILIEVHAVALNPIGWKSMSQPPISWGQQKPAIPECDVSGVVVGGSLEGYGFSEGDEVFGIIPYDKIMKTGRGALADYALMQPQLLVHKPSSLKHTEAASFPMAGLAAWQALFKSGGLQAGQRVFINGGSGGVGVYAIQISKAHGAHVVATCSPSSASLVARLGADQTVDYRDVDLPQHLADIYGEEPFDLVLDTIGVESLWEGCEGFLKPEGRFLDIGHAGPHLDGTFLSTLSALSLLARKVLLPTWLGGVRRKYVFVMFDGNKAGDDLREAAELLSKGSLKPVVDEVFSFEDAHRAYERSMSGRAQGKVVISVK